MGIEIAIQLKNQPDTFCGPFLAAKLSEFVKK
jgi:hypothetical protein